MGGQLGHDVMNELAGRGYEGIGSDIAPVYSGIQDGTAVTQMPYVPLDITDRASVDQILSDLCPDVVVHCAAWTAVDMAADADQVQKVSQVNAAGTEKIDLSCQKLDCYTASQSTDPVIDGLGPEPVKPQRSDKKPDNDH